VRSFGIVALTGRSGTGKSFACDFLRSKGVPVVIGDVVAREVVEKGSTCLRELVEYFSDLILNNDGTLNRHALADIAFSSEQGTIKLNAITHPYILKRMDEFFDCCQKKGYPYCIVEAAALVESGLIGKCDKIVVIKSDKSIQLDRIKQRDGIDDSQANTRLDAQHSQNEYDRIADIIIENNGTKEEFCVQLEKLFIELNNLYCKEKNMDSKSEMQLLEEKLFSDRKVVFDRFAGEYEPMNAYCDEYIDFINKAKTEREFVDEAQKLLDKEGYKPFDAAEGIKKGQKVYINNRNKSMIVAVGGKRPLSDGIRIMAAHIDSPRLDLKPNPLYESSGIGYFKTHYYGGIKKYQWVALPMSMHGVLYTADGSQVKFNIGEKEGDPVFCISDLLPHLSHKVQDSRTASEVIKGEELNLIIASEPVNDPAVKEPVKLAVLKFLNDNYGIVEDDFVSADIEFVPAHKAGYIGFDKSLIGGYAQDDRVCAFASLKALLTTDEPEYTTLCIVADREEIGSDGNTGLHSDMLRHFVSLIAKRSGVDAETVLLNSKCLSADVTAAFDPTFPEVMERYNCSMLNKGISVEKYTGAAGKVRTSEASAEMMSFVRRLFDGAGVPWQANEMGKIDEGGGGTVAMYIANLGVDVVDVGVPLLSMHSPYEISSKLDVYAMYKAFSAFAK